MTMLTEFGESDEFHRDFLTLGRISSRYVICLPNEHVIGDIVKMAAVFEPGSGGGNVVSRAFALDLDQNGQISQVLAVPLVERLQKLQALRRGTHINLKHTNERMNATSSMASLSGQNMSVLSSSTYFWIEPGFNKNSLWLLVQREGELGKCLHRDRIHVEAIHRH